MKSMERLETMTLIMIYLGSQCTLASDSLQMGTETTSTENLLKPNMCST